LNGYTRGGWIDCARQIEKAGASALELNLYRLATEPEENAEEIERESVELVSAIEGSVQIPIAVKLSPFYTALPHFAERLRVAGAAGLVLFNRFYQPDIDPEEMDVRPALKLSDSSELRLRLRWLAILSAQLRGLDFAASGGVHTGLDAIKAIMSGARVVQVVSALLMHGADHLKTIVKELERWLAEHDYENVEQLRASMSLRNCPDPTAFERANYMRVLQSWRC
jgi:dihydroorotate dehydrogenase (fumarate)